MIYYLFLSDFDFFLKVIQNHFVFQLKISMNHHHSVALGIVCGFILITIMNYILIFHFFFEEKIKLHWNAEQSQEQKLTENADGLNLWKFLICFIFFADSSSSFFSLFFIWMKFHISWLCLHEICANVATISKKKSLQFSLPEMMAWITLSLECIQKLYFNLLFNVLHSLCFIVWHCKSQNPKWHLIIRTQNIKKNISKNCWRNHIIIQMHAWWNW